MADEAEDQKLRFEKAKFAEELAIKRDELDLKKAELKRQSRFWNQVSPVAIALFAAFVGLTGNLVVTFIQGRNSADIESRKSQAAMIAEAIKTGDEARAKRNVLFFLDAGLITDPDGKIRTALQAPGGTPVLPSGQNVERLSQELGLSRDLVTKFLSILQEQNVPPEKTQERLREVAARYRELKAELDSLGDFSSATARDAIEKGNFELADRLLTQDQDRVISRYIQNVVGLADIYSLQRQFDKAKPLYQRAITMLKPDDPYRKTIEAKLAATGDQAGKQSSQ